MTASPDILIIGAGMAGACAGFGLATGARVTILEQEALPGYHTTGRSAAFYAETYGNEAVRKLTSASKSFFLTPPDGFAKTPLVRDRGALFIGRADQEASLDALYRAKSRVLPGVLRVEPDFIEARVPSIRPGYAAGGVWDPECRDIDVHALHQAYLAGFRARGGTIVTGAEVTGLTRVPSGWQVTCRDGRHMHADVVINAAGAWADRVATLAGAAPVGLSPRRRTVVLFPGAGNHGAGGGALSRGDWPLVLDADDNFYFKSETGRVLASPGDATPMAPQDVQPDEIDVALTVDRIERVLDIRIERIETKWAGLRTFAPDDTPVVGEAPAAPGFFWFAGQGGYGIQTAPAMSALIAGLVMEGNVPGWLGDHGVTAAIYSPARFRGHCGPLRGQYT